MSVAEQWLATLKKSNVTIDEREEADHNAAAQAAKPVVVGVGGAPEGTY